MEFKATVSDGEDGYLISEVLALSGCHTQAKSHDELMRRTKEAVALYLNCDENDVAITVV